MNRRSLSIAIAAVCGVAPLLLGLVVLFGWYSRNTTLIQVSPAFVPMQYNTALGFLLSGIGILFVLRRRSAFAAITGGAVFLIGGLTLVEYVFNISLGIDELLMEHYVTVETSNPGRMAPNTALSFFLTGLALLSGRFDVRKNIAGKSIGLLGALVFGLGAIAASGYMMGLETAYGWGNLTRMAVHTSAGFIVLGIGMLATVWTWDADRTGDRMPSWLPFAVGIGIATLTLSLWQALNAVAAVGIAQYFVLVFGVLSAIALTALLVLLQKIRQHRKQLEEQIGERTRELVQQKTTVESVLENMDQGVIMYDGDMIVTAFNEQSRRCMRLPEDVLFVGASFHDIGNFTEKRGDAIAGDTGPRTGDSRENAVDDIPHLLEHVHADGAVIEVRRRSAPGGGFVVTQTDITERKQAEANLAKKEAQLRSALDSMSGGIFMCNEKLEITLFNNKYAELFEYREGAVWIGRSLYDLWRDQAERGESWASMDDASNEALAEPYLTGRNTVAYRQLDNGRILEMAIAPMDDGGTVCVVGDVTERKQAEDALNANLSELEQFNKLAVGRELRMIELKQEVNTMLASLGEKPVYEIVQ